MATQTLPQVVSFPQSVPVVEISQQDLVDLIEARNTFAKLKKHVEKLEESVQTRLEAGASVESGVHVAELKESFRRNVSWKDVVIRLAGRLKLNGEADCAKVLVATKPSRTVSLVVE
jgi:hypothetical protein